MIRACRRGFPAARFCCGGAIGRGNGFFDFPFDFAQGPLRMTMGAGHTGDGSGIDAMHRQKRSRAGGAQCAPGRSGGRRTGDGRAGARPYGCSTSSRFLLSSVPYSPRPLFPNCPLSTIHCPLRMWRSLCAATGRCSFFARGRGSRVFSGGRGRMDAVRSDAPASFPFPF